MPRYTTGGDGSRRRTVVRLYILGAFFALGFGILASRAILFHLKDDMRLERVAIRQYRTAVRESTRRGKILDATGRDLAVNIEAPSVWADPRMIENPLETANKLSSLLDVDRNKIYSRLTSQRKFVWVKRWVPKKKVDEFKDMNIKGIYIERENKRSYPNGSLAAATLGAVGLDSKPLGGIELVFNDYLVQQFKAGSYKRDARGHLYLSPVDAVSMNSPNVIELTIDKTIQYIAESSLKHTMEITKAKAGVIVVVDPKNGDVLAIANSPSFDPNEYGRYKLDRWKNRAISDPYEPGSTFKVVVVSSALEAGTVIPTQIFDCENGEIKIGRHTLNDAHPHEELSVADIIKVSSNIGAYKVESTLGPERSYEAIRNFGFGEKTEIDLPGESTGIVQSPKYWSEVQFATIAFGQGISATPLQMTMAFAAIANGGDLLKPRIVKRIRDEEGHVIKDFKREVRRRPISRNTARIMTEMLEAVASDEGTGRLAASLDYPVAGKTGTAQKASPTGGYLKGEYYSSFVGFAPADDPKLVVYVGLDEPQGYYYGGQVAAPAFREVVEKTLRYLKFPSRRPLIVSSEEPTFNSYAKSELPQTPDVVPIFEQIDNNKWLVPDFTGLTMRGVAKAVGNIPIDIRFVGSGVAVKQKPKPGKKISQGEEFTIEFRSIL